MDKLTPAIVHLTSRNEVRVRELTIRDNTICLITSGIKYLLKNESNRIRYNTNSLLMFHKGSKVDIINEPPANAPYKATIVALSPDYIESFHKRYQHELSSIGAIDSKGARTGISLITSDTNLNAILKETFMRTIASIEAFNNEAFNNNESLNTLVYRHRLDELCLMLASLGYQFKTDSELSISEKIYRLIGNQLEKPWRKSDVAKMLNMSESTLERRLKLEDTSFSYLLRTLRLEHAMSLLLQNQLSVSEVAYACGYQSHSRFSEAFYKHFDVLPSNVC